MTNLPPTVTGTMSRDGLTVSITCPHCGRKHTHGAGNGAVDGSLGHRVGHCSTGPRNDGYCIEVVPTHDGILDTLAVVPAHLADDGRTVLVAIARCEREVGRLQVLIDYRPDHHKDDGPRAA